MPKTWNISFTYKQIWKKQCIIKFISAEKQVFYVNAERKMPKLGRSVPSCVEGPVKAVE